MQALRNDKRTAHSSGSAINHIGIIMDGNRRFAKKLMLEPWKGHEWGNRKVEDFIEWCTEFGIKCFTFYTLSLENIAGRPKIELDYIYRLMEKVASDVIKNKKHQIHVKKVRFRVIGKKDCLPSGLRKLFDRVEQITKNYKNYQANFAIAYSSRMEIIDAVKKIVDKVKNGKLDASDVNEITIKENFYNPEMSDPDLIIRTGGEKRLSNFLLFQSAYSELFFTDTSWPEFSKSDFEEAINDFNQRKRRFGA